MSGFIKFGIDLLDDAADGNAVEEDQDYTYDEVCSTLCNSCISVASLVFLNLDQIAFIGDFELV